MLEIKNVSYKIGKKTILDHISFKLSEGEFLVITGPNGSGKSTLAQIIMGIKNPTEGQILFNQQDITNLSIAERAKLGIAFAFQQPVKFKGLTVRELLKIANKQKNPNDLLKTVGLEPENYLDREIDSTLSGGELKRIEIATVLAREAKLSLFDEPEAGIDLWSFENLTSTFKELKNDKTGRGIIIVSHQERILKIADKILILENGKIKTIGKASSVFVSMLEDKK